MSKKQIDHIIFESLFRQAIIDDFDEELDSVKSNEQLPELYFLSEKFESRMEKLLKKDRRRGIFKNVIYNIKKTAYILIIILGLLFVILVFKPELRASIGKFLFNN